MNPKIELVIFDCDGVVIDSEVLSAQVLIDMLVDKAVFIDRAYVQEHFLGCNFKAVTQKIADAFNVELPERFEADYRNALLHVFGSLIGRSEASLATLNQLVDVANFKVFDVNLRAPHYTLDTLVDSMNKADFIKLNDEELYKIAKAMGCKFHSL